MAYGYDSVGRLYNVTGAGLAGGIGTADGTVGAKYAFLADSDMLSRIDFNTNGPGAPGLATTTRSFEPTRDLITQIENKWGATTVSKYVYRSDQAARRQDVVLSGTAFNLTRFIKFGYDDRDELTSNRWYTCSKPDDTSTPIANRQFTYNFDPIGNRTTDTGDPATNTTTYAANGLRIFSPKLRKFCLQFSARRTRSPVGSRLNMATDASARLGGKGAALLSMFFPQLRKFCLQFLARRTRSPIGSRLNMPVRRRAWGVRAQSC